MGSLLLRVDDYPGTKPEEFDRHNFENFLSFWSLVVRAHGFAFTLGMIPRHLKFVDIQIADLYGIDFALHGINHDERFPNEFREYQTEDEITSILLKNKMMLESFTRRPVHTYIPPHNVLDLKTSVALKRAGFSRVMVGPETDPEVIELTRARNELRVDVFLPPFEYGRSDELIQRGSLDWLIRQKYPKLCLHWTWEHNIGLEYLDVFLTQLEKKAIIS